MYPNAWKIMPVTFLWLETVWQNLNMADFAKVRPITKKSDWHDFSCIWVRLFELFWFPKFWSKFDQVWPNFDQILTSKMFSFKPKMGFPKMDWFPKFEVFYPFKSYSTLCAQNSKANFTVTLRPLKLQIAEKVLRPMKFRPKPSVFTYPHPF